LGGRTTPRAAALARVELRSFKHGDGGEGRYIPKMNVVLLNSAEYIDDSGFEISAARKGAITVIEN
jgi:hypothetical protein